MKREQKNVSRDEDPELIDNMPPHAWAERERYRNLVRKAAGYEPPKSAPDRLTTSDILASDERQLAEQRAWLDGFDERRLLTHPQIEN